MIDLKIYLLTGAILFCTGLFAVLTKRNAVMVLLGIELMINAALINLVAFAQYDKIEKEGQMMALFAIVLAAAGVAVALAIILNVYERFKTIDPGKIDVMKE